MNIKTFLSITALTLVHITTSANAAARFDITYCRTHWILSPDTLYIEGSVHTRFKPMDANTSQIDFDLATCLHVDSILHNDSKATFTHSDNKLIVDLQKTIAPGQEDSVTIYYHGQPVSTGFGSFRISRYYHTLWTLSESFGAKDWWPCRQNFYDKIDSMDIYVDYPSRYEVATNGSFISTEKNNGLKKSHYSERHPINHYMVGVAVGDYEVHQSKTLLQNKKVIDMVDYSWPGTDYPSDNLELTGLLLNFFSNLYISYPYSDEKYGHAQMGWSGGIEHQTMTFLSDFEPVTVIHELAHQWFGNYVTCKGWSNIWVNEGFASYSEYLAIHEYFPNDSLRWKTFKRDNALTAKYPIHVTDTTNMNVIFDQATTYDKGAMVLVMLRNEIGDKAFFKGCRKILDDYGSGFATIDDVRRCFETAADTTLANFFDNWVYETNYPVYEVKYEMTDDNNLLIKVQQSCSDNSDKFFPMHIKFQIDGNNGECKLVRLHNTQPVQEFKIPVDFRISDVIFDPFSDILCDTKQ